VWQVPPQLDYYPWELPPEQADTKEAEQASFSISRNRKLLDAFGDSLKYQNRKQAIALCILFASSYIDILSFRLLTQ
jgi:hypothetical protein